CQQGYSDPYSF
nr:immunoglobulin light chain junction region [Macaca mulatta]